MKSPNETLSAALAASLDHASDEGFGTGAAASDAEAERCGILARPPATMAPPSNTSSLDEQA